MPAWECLALSGPAFLPYPDTSGWSTWPHFAHLNAYGPAYLPRKARLHPFILVWLSLPCPTLQNIPTNCLSCTMVPVKPPRPSPPKHGWLCRSDMLCPLALLVSPGSVCLTVPLGHILSCLTFPALWHRYTAPGHTQPRPVPGPAPFSDAQPQMPLPLSCM